MIKNIRQSEIRYLSNEPLPRPGKNPEKENIQLDCFSKQPEKDAFIIKNGSGQKLRTTYMRWDDDIKIHDRREAKPVSKRKPAPENIVKKYRELAKSNIKLTLGSIRQFFGTIGINTVGKEMEKNSIPDQFKK